jgi:hypothetical protein
MKHAEALCKQGSLKATEAKTILEEVKYYLQKKINYGMQKKFFFFTKEKPNFQQK